MYRFVCRSLHTELVFVGRIRLDADDGDVVLAGDVVRDRTFRLLVDHGDVGASCSVATKYARVPERATLD
jgi:hypothetical protein